MKCGNKNCPSWKNCEDRYKNQNKWCSGWFPYGCLRIKDEIEI